MGINNLGINFFAASIVTLDFRKSQLRIDEQRPVNRLQFYPLKRTSSDAYGLLEIPLTFGDKSVMGMFDTGTAITAVDLKFIEANPKMFELVSNDGNASDIANKDFTVSIYKAKSVQVGSLTLENIYVSAFDFKDLRDTLGAGCSVIIGNNVILKAGWVLDLKANQWAIEPLE